MVMLILATLGLSLYSLTWPWMISKSTWGQLMEQYTIILNKIDVARGRCVPVPSKLMHASRFSIPNSPLNILNRGSKTSLERIVDALNPYTASPNIHLILDMIAYKSGLGVALRNLAFLEIDVHNNWRPFRPQINFVASTCEAANPQLTLEVSWKDPLALLYLKPVPNELQVHYGIEIEYGNLQDVQKLVEIVGYVCKIVKLKYFDEFFPQFQFSPYNQVCFFRRFDEFFPSLSIFQKTRQNGENKKKL